MLSSKILSHQRNPTSLKEGHSHSYDLCQSGKCLAEQTSLEEGHSHSYDLGQSGGCPADQTCCRL